MKYYIKEYKTKKEIRVKFDNKEDFRKRGLLKNLGLHWDPQHKIWRMSYNSFSWNALNRVMEDRESYEPVYKVKPYDFQHTALNTLLSTDKRALFFEMGLGKTKATIDYFNSKYYKEILVIGPKAVSYVWQEEIEKFSAQKYAVFVGLHTTKKKKDAFKKFIDCDVPYKIYITNYETAKKKFLQNHKFDLVVFDESSKLKNHQTQRYKACKKIDAMDSLILTGTPWTNSPVDVFNQLVFTSPHIFGTNPYRFKFNWCEVDYFKAVKGLQPERETEFKELLREASIIIKKKDVIKDLPDKIYQKRLIEMSGKHMKNYKELEAEKILYLKENNIIQPATVLTVLLRLRELAGGFYREAGEVLEYGDKNKIEAMQEIINETDEKFVIFYNFTPEKEIIEKNIKGCISYEGFREGEDGHLLLNVRQGYGLNLQKKYRTIIFYSQLYSREVRLQAEDRIHRIGIETNPLIIDLLYKDTIEESIYKSRHDLIKMIREMVYNG
jgi:SNF2 family DNA or RNA helicase